jgi:glucose-6-phosphate 1-dehydrogenase
MELREQMHAHWEEEQILRIDHFLGKETTQNLMVFRFANRFLEPIWNTQHIAQVQITYAETLGVEQRASYYDKAGALRDMLQNHLMQLFSLAAMEPPSSWDAEVLRDHKVEVLRSVVPITAKTVDQHAVRGQYRAGKLGRKKLVGYRSEPGIKRGSDTETFAALRLEVDNWRWRGVPFYLRSGKRLASRVSEIVVAFRPIPHSVFDGAAGPIDANRLVIRLQPDEGVRLWLMIKDPGPGGMRLAHVPLDMSFASVFNVRNPDAYERLLMDVVRGNQTLFMRRDEVEAAWTWVDPILEAWSSTSEPPKQYTSGTWGPSASIALIERNGRTWHEDDDG